MPGSSRPLLGCMLPLLVAEWAGKVVTWPWGDSGAGLHRETLAAARAQAALLCTLLPGAHVPLSAALLQVTLPFSLPSRHLTLGRLTTH